MTDTAIQLLHFPVSSRILTLPPFRSILARFTLSRFRFPIVSFLSRDKEPTVDDGYHEYQPATMNCYPFSAPLLTPLSSGNWSENGYRSLPFSSTTRAIRVTSKRIEIEHFSFLPSFAIIIAKSADKPINKSIDFERWSMEKIFHFSMENARRPFLLYV